MRRRLFNCALLVSLAAVAAAAQQHTRVWQRVAGGQSVTVGSAEDNGKIVTGGVLNGKAVAKPAPVYPPIAKAARAQGTVTVQILVDEEGYVISASAVSGHPLLQQASVLAARQARFTPTRLQGEPVKVSGLITYNYVLQ